MTVQQKCFYDKKNSVFYQQKLEIRIVYQVSAEASEENLMIYIVTNKTNKSNRYASGCILGNLLPAK